jgi:hypothetical protein
MLPAKRRYLGKIRLSGIGTLLSMGLLLVVICVGLVACGSNTTTGGASNPTPTVSTQAQLCGSVQANPMGHPLNGTTAKQAEDCFWQAEQKCQPASLTYIAGGVDTITTHVFTIQSNSGKCSVSDAMTHAIVPSKPSVPKTYTCGSVNQQADGLHFTACGDEGDIVVPMVAG